MPRQGNRTAQPPEERLAQAREIGGRIRAHRISLGLTQQQVAEPEFTKAYISALETGIARPSMRSLEYIAEKLNVAPSRLFDADDALPEPIATTIVWVRVGDARVVGELQDGREIGIPLKNPVLRGMRIADLDQWRIGLGGRVIVWPKTGTSIGLNELFGISETQPVPPPSGDHIADRIRRARQDRGLTQAQVAGSRFSPAYIAQMERGQVATTVAALSYIADRLRIRRADLLGGSPDAGPVPPPAPLRAESVRLMDGRLYLALDDGRELGVPLELIPTLLAHTMDEITRWSIARNGAAIRWSALGFEIKVEEYGRPSLAVG